MAKRARKSSGCMASKGFPIPIDVHVGNRIRLRRTLLGISQERLAEQIGLTFQQVQMYERGANRVSSSHLFDFAQILDVDLSYFFADMDPGLENKTPSKLTGRPPGPWRAGRHWSSYGPITRSEIRRCGSASSS